MSVRETRSRAELYAEACWWRERGFTTVAIAQLMGKRTRTVYNWFYDPDGSKQRARRKSYEGTCADCGGVTKSDGTKRASARCATCAAEHQHAERIWTRETIIAAIQLFARENGRPPLATEWLVGPRDRRFPPASAIYRHNGKSRYGRRNPFASWADAIEAAGFPRPRVGQKVLPRGQGRNHMARTYVVLTQNGDGHLKSQRVEAFSAEHAIEAVAQAPGEYIAVLDRYWVAREVAPVTKLAIVKEPARA